MGLWSYEGLDKAGKRVQGKINAKDEREARKTLRSQGIRPKKVIPPSILEFDINQWLVDKGFAKSFGTKELTHFTKQLSIMINAGVPILQSLEVMYKQEPNPSLKNAIKKISKSVGEGKTLAESMAMQNGFDKLYCNLVKAGEAGGILDTILEKLAEHMEKQQKTKAQIKSAMTYPIIVLVIGFAVCFGMMIFVVPQFTGMLTESGQEIPWITQFVIDVSDLLQKYALISIPAIIIAGMILSALIKTPAGKVVWDRLMMNMPIFGGIIIKGNMNSFTRTLSTMLSSGVSLTDSLDICISTVENSVIADDLKSVKKAVVEGKTLTEPLLKISYFPDMVSQMVKVGEQTGNIDRMLLKVANVFEEEVNNLVSNMTKMIEPLILVFLGGFVGTILIAMYLPIFLSAGGA